MQRTDADEARAYARWCKRCLAVLDAGRRVQIDRARASRSREQWHAEFLQELHKRINQKAGPAPRWRKLDCDYQIRLYRDSRRLRDIARRIRVYQFETDEARSRYADRLSRWDD